LIPKTTPVNVVTIYRVLDLFESLGLIHRVHTKEGYLRCAFEIKKGCHSFAICTDCGHADEFVSEQCEMEGKLPKNLTYKSLSHISEFSGICTSCRKK